MATDTSSLSYLDKPRLDNLAEEIWKSAERLRGKFKAAEYQNVVLPIITIRRLECVLIAWREKKAAEILAGRPEMEAKTLRELVKTMEMNERQSPGFGNSTHLTLEKITRDNPTQLEANFRKFLKGFTDNVQDIIDSFNYRAVVGQMAKKGRLAPILNQYAELDLSPARISSLEMGYIYEELLRRFSEQHAEAAGDHFTPREVIRLMVELLEMPIPEKPMSIYDPACGTGGMLYVAKEHLLDKASNDAERAKVEKFVTLHGTELMDETYAIAVSESLIRGESMDQTTIRNGNSLIPHDPQNKESGDQFPESKHRFDYMLSNPPFGVTWGGKDGYEAQARKFKDTRYKAGMPAIRDGSLLFLQTIMAKMKPVEKGGSKVAIIFNGSPLSNGDCGSGESEIRRWILENDWLDGIVMLPNDLFYNTGIYTYIWLLRNDRKKIGRDGRVMLIDARKQFEKEPKSFGNKRNRITAENRAWIEQVYRDGWKREEEDVRIFRTTDFAFHKVSVVFWQTGESGEPAIIREPFPVAFTPANVKKQQDFYGSGMTLHLRLTLNDGTARELDVELTEDTSFANVFPKAVKQVFADAWKRLGIGGDAAAVRKFVGALQVDAEFTHRHYIDDDEYIPYDPEGNPAEYIPAFLEREIGKPIIRWHDRPQLGYEILPNKYFYRYTEPRKADDLLKEFWVLEKTAEKLLKGLAEETV